jgi:hypothetical protein
MEMKKNILALLIGALCATMGAHAATLTWTGAGNGVSLYETNNWDNGHVIGVANFKDIPVPHDFIVDDGAATVGGAGGVGGTLDLAGTGSLTVSNGTFRMGAAAVIKDGSAWVNGSNFGYIQGTLDNADFYSTWGISLGGSMNLTNGSSFEATWFAGGGICNIDGASTLTIREDGAGSFNGTTVNFQDFDSKIIYTNLNRTVSEVISEHLSKFTVNGATAVVGENINIFTDPGTGQTTVQALSAPLTFTWSGAGDGTSLFATNNWDSAINLGTDNFNNLPVPYYFTVTNGTPGGAGGFNGTLDLATNGSLTVSAGTFKMGSAAVITDGSVSISGSQFGRLQGTLDHVDFYVGGGSSLAGSMDLLNGSTYDTVWFAGGGICDIDGASTLKIRENGAGSFNGTTIDFLDFDSKIIYTSGYSVENVIANHLSRFTVNGATATNKVNIYIFEDPDSGYTTVQAISEPIPPEPIVIEKLLDDPTWATSPAGLDGGIDQWRWNNPGILWETTAANTNVTDNFDAGPVTLTNRTDIIDHPDYDVNQTLMTAISTTWESGDFTYASTASYDPDHVIEAWYTIVITAGSGTFTGTSGIGKIHDGPTRLPSGNNGMLQANLAAAWNTLTWDIDPFAGGGLVFSDIASIDVDFFADTTGPNTNASGSAWFTMNDSGLEFSASTLGFYDYWALSYGLTNGMAAPDYDVEPDGLDNLMEYALGGNPTVADAAAVLPAYWAENDGSSNWFYYVHNKRNDPSLTYAVKATDNLAMPSWDSDGVDLVGESEETDGFTTVTNRTDVDAAEFLTLEVSQ